MDTSADQSSPMPPSGEQQSPALTIPPVGETKSHSHLSVIGASTFVCAFITLFGFVVEALMIQHAFKSGSILLAIAPAAYCLLGVWFLLELWSQKKRGWVLGISCAILLGSSAAYFALWYAVGAALLMFLVLLPRHPKKCSQLFKS